MNIQTVGIDLAKDVFQVHAVDQRGRTILQKRLSRKNLMPFLATLPSCTIGVEACSSSSYWARRLQELGHSVRLMSPQYVKPYVKTNKNDYNDAEAICEAVTRPNMRFVSIKTVEQQDIQAIHRIRERLVRVRTALINQTRGLLREYGVFIPTGRTAFKARIGDILESAENELSIVTRELIADQVDQLRELEQRISQYDERIHRVFQNSPLCQRLAGVNGVGPMTSTAIVSAVGDAGAFRNGRQLAAWLGLVPRQYSSGGKTRLLGISKRGNTYLRTLLIHGARAVLRYSQKGDDPQSRWLRKLIERRGFNKACVALANKNARILWAMMARGTAYQPAT
jgi:transposase